MNTVFSLFFIEEKTRNKYKKKTRRELKEKVKKKVVEKKKRNNSFSEAVSLHSRIKVLQALQQKKKSKTVERVN